jgi:hypothetical protein
MAFGIGLVLSLWALAAVASRNTARGGLVSFAAAWGLVIWILGFAQTHILPGSFHWVVEVAHLAVGMIGIGVGGRLASAVAEGQVTPSLSA